MYYMASLSGAGAACFLWGSDRERIAWSVLFIHWFFSIWYFEGHRWELPFNFVFYGLFGVVCYRYGVTRYGDGVTILFALLLILTGLASLNMIGINLLSIERGLGITALTYWNLQAWLLHFICLLLVGAAFARYNPNFRWF